MCTINYSHQTKMAAIADDVQRTSKSSKWFATKSLKLSFRHRSSSSKSTSSPSSSPSSHFPSPPRHTNREDEFREVFKYFDGDGDGRISATELRAYFGSIGEYMSYEEAEAVINELDSDSDSLLTFGDFLRLMKKEDGEGGDEEDEDLKRAFEMFELEKGFITPRSLQRMLLRLGDTRSYDECAIMIRVYDTDGNGVLDFNEFHRMMA